MPTNDVPSESSDRATTALASLAALMAQVVLQFALGAILATRYGATPEGAHASVSAMPHFLRGFQFWGNAVLIVHAVGHLCAATWTGMYRKPYRTTYWAVLAISALALGTQVTGNLLPFDKHAVQSANAEAAIGAQVPVAGRAIAQAMLGGASFSSRTLALWYGIHIAVGIAMLATSGLVLIAIRRGPKPKWSLAAYPIALSAVAAMMFGAPLGKPAGLVDYGLYNALPGWYVWPLHGTNVAATTLFGAGWIGTVLLPAVAIFFLLALPFVGERIGRRTTRAVFGLFVGLFAVSAVGFGGRVAAVTGDRDPPIPQNAGRAMVAQVGQNAALAAQGRRLFGTVGCASCHGVDGMQAKFGPSLATVFKRHSDAAFYEKYIRNPKSVDPGSEMPAFEDLKPTDLKALAEFLRFPR